MIPLVANIPTATCSILNASYDIHFSTQADILTIGGNGTRIELLIHRQRVASHRLRPILADLVLRLAGEDIHAGGIAELDELIVIVVSYWRVTRFLCGRVFNHHRGVVRESDVPAVSHGRLTAHGRRVRDGLDFIIRAKADLFRVISSIDGARIELRTHIDRGVLRFSLRAITHMSRHREMERGVISEGDDQRVVGNRLGLVVQLPRIGQRVVRGGIRLQLDRGPVTDRVRGEQHVIIISMIIYINIVKSHLRVINDDSNGLHILVRTLTLVRRSRDRVSGRDFGGNGDFRSSGIGVELIVVGRSPLIGHFLGTIRIQIRSGSIIGSRQLSGITITYYIIGASRGGDLVQFHIRVKHRHRHTAHAVHMTLQTGILIGQGGSRRNSVGGGLCRQRLNRGDRVVAQTGNGFPNEAQYTICFLNVIGNISRYGGAVAAEADGRHTNEGRILHLGLQYAHSNLQLICNGTKIFLVRFPCLGSDLHAVSPSKGDIIEGVILAVSERLIVKVPLIEERISNVIVLIHSQRSAFARAENGLTRDVAEFNTRVTHLHRSRSGARTVGGFIRDRHCVCAKGRNSRNTIVFNLLRSHIVTPLIFIRLYIQSGSFQYCSSIYANHGI